MLVLWESARTLSWQLALLLDAYRRCRDSSMLLNKVWRQHQKPDFTAHHRACWGQGKHGVQPVNLHREHEIGLTVRTRTIDQTSLVNWIACRKSTCRPTLLRPWATDLKGYKYNIRKAAPTNDPGRSDIIMIQIADTLDNTIRSKAPIICYNTIRPPNYNV